MTDETTDKDVAFIRALADMVNSADLNEIEVEREIGKDEKLKVRLTRGATVVAASPAPVAMPAAPAAAGPAAPAPAAAAPAAPEAPAASEGPDLSNAVTSPMVGTVYLAPEPGAGNFVSVGDQVQEGQTILIIEAMKTMNQIPSPRAGTVRAIMVENAEPVEFGEPLVVVE